MSKVQILRALLKQRLPADDEEIFELFERTTAEYEEELCGLKEENERQRKLLDAVFNSDDKTDVQQLLVNETEVPPEQQACMSSLDQEDSELHHIKKEKEELWTCEELAHLQVLKVNSSMYTNDVTPQSSHYQPQSEENREDEPLASSSCEQMKMENDEEDWRRSEPVGSFDQDCYFNPHSDAMMSHNSGTETDVSDVDWRETTEPNSSLNSLTNEVHPVCVNRCNAGVKPYSPECDQRILHKTVTTYNEIHMGEKLLCSSEGDETCNQNSHLKTFKCSECGKAFSQKGHLKRHMTTHTGNTSFKCSECGKTFNQNFNLKTHMLIHTGERPFSCSECGKTFNNSSNLKTHLLIHRGERRFCCSECGKVFNQNSNLKAHMLIHTGERPFSCSDCGKTFNTKGCLKIHMLIHTGERPFSCSECGKTFNKKCSLKTHMLIHTGERPFCCSDCGKTFNKKCSLKTHMLIHTGERPFHCSQCGKAFNQNSLLKMHMLIHTGERPFSCSLCGKTFNRNNHLKTHMIFHKGYKPFHCSECGKAFVLNSHLKRHMITHPGEKAFSAI
ncbi:gastrula zinc finger protein XlCGF57.1-like isoform X3 [Thalassophryne amazonica]|uniref:gastrula zinc finger protein XlCGF57.1-like isoform X3 n=1 Tax=Thalassophryne amazonica TaxID=390379 RepID=UPI001471A7A7|nr:gastrula zinc finger protein XlCGF57.1-like isoform X3 [Thalassophryne amazonica]